jgi:hypothetical protein
MSSDLQFATTKELIAELVNRSTFSGVVIHLDNHLLRPGVTPVYQVDWANLNTDEAIAAVGAAGEVIDRSAWGKTPDSF